MDHDKIKHLIAEFQDGELQGSSFQFVQEHVQQCSECRQEVDGWDKLKKTFFSSQPVKAPAYFSTRVMAQIAGSKSSQGRTSKEKLAWPWWVSTLSMGFATILLVLTFLPQERMIGVEDLINSNNYQDTVDELLNYPTGEEQ